MTVPLPTSINSLFQGWGTRLKARVVGGAGVHIEFEQDKGKNEGVIEMRWIVQYLTKNNRT